MDESYLDSTHNVFNFATVNLNSITNKLHYVHNLIADYSLHVVSVTETWLTNSCDASFVNIPQFVFYRGDVLGEVRKHGAGLYVSSKIKSLKLSWLFPMLLWLI